MSHLPNRAHLSLVPHARAAALRSGALAALGTWAVVVLPALVGWLAAPEGSLGWFSAVQVGTAIWFLGHGQSIGGSDVVVSLTPIGLVLVFVYVAVRWGGRVLDTQRALAARSEWSRVARLGIVPGFLAGYVGAAAGLALLTLGGKVAPGVAAVPGTALVPLVALGYLLVRPEDPESPAFVRAWFRRGPSWLPSAWRVGWRGAVLLLGLGLAVSLLRLLWCAGDVLAIHADFGFGPVAGAVVLLAQVMMLGNAATWALAFVAGPGFSIAAGSLISPGAAQPGLMPLVPILGALPEAADYPPAMYAVLLIPVVAGALIGRRVDAVLEFFGNARARLLATATAGAISVAVVALVTWLGNGSIGVERLVSVGASVPYMMAALLLEVLAGALGWAGWCLWRERPMDAPDDGRQADESHEVDEADLLEQ